MASQAQPLPKRVRAALVNSAWKFSKLWKVESMAAASSPVGVPPAFGVMMSQNKVWL